MAKQKTILEIVTEEVGGWLRLGLGPSAVADLLGEPGAAEDWMGGNLNEAFAYPGMLLLFDNCDGNGPLPDAELQMIQIVAHSGVLVLGKGMRDWRRQSLRTRLAQDGWYVVEEGPRSLALPKNGCGFTFDESDTLMWVELESDVPEDCNVAIRVKRRE